VSKKAIVQYDINLKTMPGRHQAERATGNYPPFQSPASIYIANLFHTTEIPWGEAIQPMGFYFHGNRGFPFESTPCLNLRSLTHCHSEKTAAVCLLFPAMPCPALQPEEQPGFCTPDQKGKHPGFN
jgi:hypothetical protein